MLKSGRSDVWENKRPITNSQGPNRPSFTTMVLQSNQGAFDSFNSKKNQYSYDN